MRKIVWFMSVSLNGYIEGPNRRLTAGRARPEHGRPTT